jgi:uncharacterized protein (DUF952 family)
MVKTFLVWLLYLKGLGINGLHCTIPAQRATGMRLCALEHLPRRASLRYAHGTSLADPEPLTLIYKITPAALWHEAGRAGRFTGAPVDLADGFIHFSTAEQTRETASRHFRGQADLLLVAVEAEALGSALKWEPSRGGALFPHLYGALPLEAVRAVAPVPTRADGGHDFTGLLP